MKTACYCRAVRYQKMNRFTKAGSFRIIRIMVIKPKSMGIIVLLIIVPPKKQFLSRGYEKRVKDYQNIRTQ